jgi:hypothetical protein
MIGKYLYLIIMHIMYMETCRIHHFIFYKALTVQMKTKRYKGGDMRWNTRQLIMYSVYHTIAFPIISFKLPTTQWFLRDRPGFEWD